MSPSPDLASLLPDPPARVVVLGGGGAGDGLEESGLEVLRVRQTRELDPAAGLFGAAVWHVDGSSEPPAAAIEALRRHLGDDGRVIVVAPRPAGEPAPERRRGSLPSRREARLREAVRRLSEGGFAIFKDEVKPSPAAGEGFRVLAARPDRFVVRPWREGDEEAILRLFRACFHVDRSLDHWRWKYAANPYAPPLVSLAFSGDGALAAHYSGYSIPFWRAGRSFAALQMGDTMTDASFRDTGRGRGSLLARTVRHFFSIHRDGTFGFFYGFNTGPIQRFCRWFIGGSDTLPVRYLVRDPGSALPVAPGGTPGSYRVERVERVGGAWDRFFRRVAPSYGFLVKRDACYLDWRYLRCPDPGYVLLAARRWGRLVGWSVFRRREDVLQWGDALFDPRHAGAAAPILAAALAEPELAGAARVAAWFPARPAWWSERLAALGFAVRPEPQDLGLVALPDAEPEAFAALGELYYTMGDGDLF